jgi:hypothetical protein
MRRIALALLALPLAACSESPTQAGPGPRPLEAFAQCSQPAPLTGTPDPRVAGQYIVVFHDGADRLAQKYGFQPAHVYQHALRGFAATLSDAAVAGIRCESETRYVSHDGVVTIGG